MDKTEELMFKKIKIHGVRDIIIDSNKIKFGFKDVKIKITKVNPSKDFIEAVVEYSKEN